MIALAKRNTFLTRVSAWGIAPKGMMHGTLCHRPRSGWLKRHTAIGVINVVAIRLRDIE